MRKEIATFDAKVDGLLDRVRGPVADRIFYSASTLGDHSLIWFLIAAARGLRSDREAVNAFKLFAAFGAESAVVNLGIKSLFRRSRPTHTAIRPHRLRTPKTSSFPSGHATAGFNAAVLLSSGDHFAPLYFGLAAVVATSRVYVKIHHASDVVAGAATGLVLGAVARRLLLPPS